jgi:hypothetical protein
VSDQGEIGIQYFKDKKESERKPKTKKYGGLPLKNRFVNCYSNSILPGTAIDIYSVKTRKKTK